MTWRRVAEPFYWKGMVADIFCFYDTEVFREEYSGTDLTVYDRDPSREHIIAGNSFCSKMCPGVQIFWGSKFCDSRTGMRTVSQAIILMDCLGSVNFV